MLEDTETSELRLIFSKLKDELFCSLFVFVNFWGGEYLLVYQNCFWYEAITLNCCFLQ